MSGVGSTLGWVRGGDSEMTCSNVVSNVRELSVEMLTSHVADGDTESMGVSSMPVITSNTHG